MFVKIGFITLIISLISKHKFPLHMKNNVTSVFAIVSLSISAANFTVSLAIMIQIAFNIIRASNRQRMLTSFCILIIVIGYMLQSCNIQYEIKSMDVSTDQYALFYSILAPINFVGRVLLSIELTLLPFRLILQLSGKLGTRPYLQCICNRKTLKQYYQILYVTSFLYMAIVGASIITLTVMKITNVTVIGLTVLLLLVFNIYHAYYQFKGLNSLRKTFQALNFNTKRHIAVAQPQIGLVVCNFIYLILTTIGYIFPFVFSIYKCSTSESLICNQLYSYLYMINSAYRVSITISLGCAVVLQIQLKKLYYAVAIIESVVK